MSADLDNQPYDNVEFPIRRPGTGSPTGNWVSPTMTPAQRENLVTGGGVGIVRERSYTLPTVAEGGGGEEEEEGESSEVKVEDQRQALSVINSSFNTVSKMNLEHCCDGNVAKHCFGMEKGN